MERGKNKPLLCITSGGGNCNEGQGRGNESALLPGAAIGARSSHFTPGRNGRNQVRVKRQWLLKHLLGK